MDLVHEEVLARICKMQWVFSFEVRRRDGKTRMLELFSPRDMRIQRHCLVRQDANYYLNSAYFKDRRDNSPVLRRRHLPQRHRPPESRVDDGLSCVKGNFHARFLEGSVPVRGHSYSTPPPMRQFRTTLLEKTDAPSAFHRFVLTDSSHGYYKRIAAFTSY